MSPASCIYEGTIRHRRSQPPREFRHRLALFYLDLDELPWLLGGRLVARRPGVLRFRRRDYLGPPRVPLPQAVGDVVETGTGRRPTGPIRVLTQLRSFGQCFNPVSFYYCFGRDAGRVDAVVAEVTNTPWGERHAYVISEPAADGRAVRGRFAKALHVSPFMGMDHAYSARAGVPGRGLAVHIESRRDRELVFDATLTLRRRELTRSSAVQMSARYPFACGRVLALIYGHALGLKLAGAPVHRHPERPA